MSEKIRNLLSGGPLIREIIRFCREPQTPEDIVAQIAKHRENIGLGRVRYFDNTNRVSALLRNLELVSAITYDKDSNKWKSEPLSLELLAKYFGIK